MKIRTMDSADLREGATVEATMHLQPFGCVSTNRS